MTPAAAARCASSGPQNASASTFTITTCLPCSKAASACSTAGMGLPVASMMMSMSGCETSACQSSPRCVVWYLSAASSVGAENTAGFQPTRSRLALAFAGQALDRREVAVRDVARALKAPDVIRYRTERQIDDHAIPGREVGGRGVHQAAV